ncbi:MAG: uracil-DNA glycosylase [Syntrophales bacterium]|jgi:DNA polymerase|nr:uracil-DNA glycosylase [Syntrophales bacterium]MDY0043280.1 uracil-DNA glycosylase [Syntrophales bacterium]
MKYDASGRQDLLELVRAIKRTVIETQGNAFSADSDRPMAEKNILKPIPAGNRNSEIRSNFIHESLSDIKNKLGDCSRCGLYQSRRNIVFGEGSPRAELVFVGEAPGEQEDLQGKPFVGRAGGLLTKIIEAMGFSRNEVYICNILKCRPPGNRNPKPDEIKACEPFLISQLEAIQPKIICALGSFAAKTLLKKESPITVLRGKLHPYRGIYLMPTYHPAYLLRNPGAKRQVWDDMKIIMKYLSDGRN